MYIISNHIYDKRIKEAEQRGVKKGAGKKIQELEDALAKKNSKITELEETIAVLREERDDTREVVRQQILNEDRATLLDAREDGLFRREGYLRMREEKLYIEARNPVFIEE